MKYQERCESCGHIKTAYTHKLNKLLCQSLRDLIDFYERTKSACNLQRDLNLTKSQYNNFQKLQYWLLVRRAPEGWYPTEHGINFIEGRIFIPNIVATLESEVLGTWHEAWKTHKGNKPKMVSIKDIFLAVWKPRSEYQLEKTGQKRFI